MSTQIQCQSAISVCLCACVFGLSEGHVLFVIVYSRLIVEWPLLPLVTVAMVFNFSSIL